jgi:hypothetical protein
VLFDGVDDCVQLGQQAGVRGVSLWVLLDALQPHRFPTLLDARGGRGGVLEGQLGRFAAAPMWRELFVDGERRTRTDSDGPRVAWESIPVVGPRLVNFRDRVETPVELQEPPRGLTWVDLAGAQGRWTLLHVEAVAPLGAALTVMGPLVLRRPSEQYAPFAGSPFTQHELYARV